MTWGWFGNYYWLRYRHLGESKKHMDPAHSSWWHTIVLQPGSEAVQTQRVTAHTGKLYVTLTYLAIWT